MNAYMGDSATRLKRIHIVRLTSDLEEALHVRQSIAASRFVVAHQLMVGDEEQVQLNGVL